MQELLALLMDGNKVEIRNDARVHTRARERVQAPVWPCCVEHTAPDTRLGSSLLWWLFVLTAAWVPVCSAK